MKVRPRYTLERTFSAAIDEVWEMWTTREGIEAWWGPEGFKVVVKELDVRPGGTLVYAMTAVGPDQVQYMQQAGMPLVTTQRLRFVEVDRPHRLVYVDVADFIPGVEPYDVETIVQLEEVEDGTNLVLTFDTMHDERWTELARLGRESELRKLSDLLSARE